MTDDIFKCIFLNENAWILIDIPLMFVPKGQINNIPALVWIMAWRRPGDKPLSEQMMFTLLMHLCVTQPQYVKCTKKRELYQDHFAYAYSQWEVISQCNIVALWLGAYTECSLDILRLSLVSQLSFRQYWGCGLPIYLMMILRICVLYLIIIIKSEVGPICHCLWLRQEKMVDAVCIYDQSGTKPNLVAKILATNFGVFFVIYVMFSNICLMCL